MSKNSNNLKRKDGTLTAYGLKCGYVMAYEKRGCKATLYHEHNTYHIKHTAVLEHPAEWRVVYTYKEARKQFSGFCRHIDCLPLTK